MDMLYFSLRYDVKYLDIIDVMMCVVSSCALNVCLLLYLVLLFTGYIGIDNNKSNETPFLSHE